ncbi:hypothetical protein [Gloeothece verrucosa]|uniref:Uncharacterized protein n=1 Tax=Gloeothece verrucosa (strain PCC 7822) TaxID=497965 RepID=E0U842_GLOV7|nr:hypothetical protein [Gloeothece verrucosa]ADN17247.1 hypothetical protein Cyan7822_5368 [Gloeothece verrucosa PCC 7822]
MAQEEAFDLDLYDEASNLDEEIDGQAKTKIIKLKRTKVCKSFTYHVEARSVY